MRPVRTLFHASDGAIALAERPPAGHESRCAVLASAPMMRWVKQDPVTEDSCGQCCAAMLLAIPKSEAIARVGHDEGTTTREMARVLRSGGLKVGGRLKKLRSFEHIPTSRALLLGTWRRYPHWMVWDDGAVVDPVEGRFALEKPGLPRWIRVTHFLEIE